MLIATPSLASLGFGAFLAALGVVFATNAGRVSERLADLNRRSTTRPDGEPTLGRSYGLNGVVATTTLGMRVRGVLLVAVGVGIAIGQPF